MLHLFNRCLLREQENFEGYRKFTTSLKNDVLYSICYILFYDLPDFPNSEKQDPFLTVQSICRRFCLPYPKNYINIK